MRTTLSQAVPPAAGAEGAGILGEIAGLVGDAARELPQTATNVEQNMENRTERLRRLLLEEEVKARSLLEQSGFSKADINAIISDFKKAGATEQNIFNIIKDVIQKSYLAKSSNTLSMLRLAAYLLGKTGGSEELVSEFLDILVKYASKIPGTNLINNLYDSVFKNKTINTNEILANYIITSAAKQDMLNSENWTIPADLALVIGFTTTAPGDMGRQLKEYILNYQKPYQRATIRLYYYLTLVMLPYDAHYKELQTSYINLLNAHLSKFRRNPELAPGIDSLINAALKVLAYANLYNVARDAVNGTTRQVNTGQGRQ